MAALPMAAEVISMQDGGAPMAAEVISMQNGGAPYGTGSI